EDRQTLENRGGKTQQAFSEERIAMSLPCVKGIIFTQNTAFPAQIDFQPTIQPPQAISTRSEWSKKEGW
ncbi:hypothetical protein, partial [Edaphobacter acidisoli]